MEISLEQQRAKQSKLRTLPFWVTALIMLALVAILTMATDGRGQFGYEHLAVVVGVWFVTNIAIWVCNEFAITNVEDYYLKLKENWANQNSRALKETMDSVRNQKREEEEKQRRQREERLEHNCKLGGALLICAQSLTRGQYWKHLCRTAVRNSSEFSYSNLRLTVKTAGSILAVAQDLGDRHAKLEFDWIDEEITHAWANYGPKADIGSTTSELWCGEREPALIKALEESRLILRNTIV